jgi:alpha-tubulin suppressor-like RCC1 family protein
MYDFLLDKLSFKKNLPNMVMYSWGSNNQNQTSHNNYDYLSLPRYVFKLKNQEVMNLSSGWEHNLVLTRNNEVYSWGNNEVGQCGLNENSKIFNPEKIEQLKDIKLISTGNDHSMAMTTAGEIYSWGKAEDGVLGYQDKEIEYEPKKILFGLRFETFASGSIHNMALDKEGRVYSWGCSKGGQLGHSDNFLMKIPDFKGYIITPTLIRSLQEVKVTKISCGEAHSLALSKEGIVFGWGFTSNGQLGLGFCEDSFEPGQGMQRCRIPEPVIIPNGGNTIIDIQCGKTFSLFITKKYEVDNIFKTSLTIFIK